MVKHLLVLVASACFATIAIAQTSRPGNDPAHGQQSASSVQLSPAQRGEIVRKIVRSWGSYVQAVYKTRPAVWAARMASTFAAANDANLQRAAGMKTFQGMVGALVGSRVSDTQVIASLATSARVLKSGPVPALLGDVSRDLVYTPISPCRIVDTRNVGGPIVGGSIRSFIAFTSTDFSSQGGISGSDCGIPANPSALMINVAAPASTQSGYLTVWPYGTTRPFASNLDYKAGDLANNEMAAKMTTSSATAEFSVFAFGTTNVVVDAVGYFMAPEATPLDTGQESRSDVIAAGALVQQLTLACPVGYAMTGGGCFTSTDDGSTLITGNTAYFGVQYCSFKNTTANASIGYTYATCARVPGR